jgi:hypothetical protein
VAGSKIPGGKKSSRGIKTSIIRSPCHLFNKNCGSSVHKPVGKNSGSTVFRPPNNMPIFWALIFYVYFRVFTDGPFVLHSVQIYTAVPRSLFEAFCLLIGLSRRNTALEPPANQPSKTQTCRTLDGHTIKKPAGKIPAGSTPDARIQAFKVRYPHISRNRENNGGMNYEVSTQEKERANSSLMAFRPFSSR